jgi:uncharacterized glyoxalase superfamily protein PhnB
MVAYGGAELMLKAYGQPGTDAVSLWFYTDRIDDVYAALKSRQLDAARRVLEGTAEPGAGIRFTQDLEQMFYGARQFGVLDPNGYTLYFIQPTR